MTMKHAPNQRHHGELQAWYLARFAPKLARAVEAGFADRDRAERLDEQFRQLIGLPIQPTEQAA
jgi:uncharacterized protein YciW